MRFAFLAALVGVLFALPAQAQECGDGMRPFDHHVLVNDPTCIPSAPRAVAIMSSDEIVAGVMLGADLVNSNQWLNTFLELYPRAITTEKWDGLVDIGRIEQMNPEELAALEPDLIISDSWGEDGNDVLAKIAPTVVGNKHDPELTWQDNFLFVATVLEQEASAREMIDGLSTRLAEIRESLGDRSPTFAVVFANEGQPLRVYTDFVFGPRVLIEAGMQPGPEILSAEETALLERGANEANWYELSLERIGDIDVDHLFLLTGDDAWLDDQLAKSPVWRSLDVVTEGRVIRTRSRNDLMFRDNPAYGHLVADLVVEEVLGQSREEARSGNPFRDWLESE